MSFPSTTLVNIKDKLKRALEGKAEGESTSLLGDIEMEIRKADLDLLDKINKSLVTTTVYRTSVKSTTTQASAVQNKWYTIATLRVPASTVDIMWSGNISCSASNTVVQVTLSNNASAEWDQDLSAEWTMGTAAQTCDVPAYRMKRQVTLASDTILYLLVRTPSAATPTIGFSAGAGIGSIIIEAVT